MIPERTPAKQDEIGNKEVKIELKTSTQVLEKLPTVTINAQLIKRLHSTHSHNQVELTFDLVGKTSDFSIKKIDEFTKAERKRNNDEDANSSPKLRFKKKAKTSVEEEKKDFEDGRDRNTVSLLVKPTKIYLSSESLLPLAAFVATISAQFSPDKKCVGDVKPEGKLDFATHRPKATHIRSENEITTEREHSPERAARLFEAMTSARGAKEKKKPSFKGHTTSQTHHHDSVTVEEFRELMRVIKQTDNGKASQT